MESRTMTAEEVVKITINGLSRIQVPAALIQQIGIPIANAINNLNLCMECWERERAAMESDANHKEENQAEDTGDASSEETTE